MGTRRKAAPTRSVRQSVAIPAALADEVQCVAQRQPEVSHGRFVDGNEPVLKNEAGPGLIPSIFGMDSIAEGSQRRPAFELVPHLLRDRRGLRVEAGELAEVFFGQLHGILQPREIDSLAPWGFVGVVETDRHGAYLIR